MDNLRLTVDNGRKTLTSRDREALLDDCIWRIAAIGAGRLAWAG